MERIRLVTDRFGFRNSDPSRPHYDIVALGDSFTHGSGAPNPWPQRLAEFTGSSVLNLGASRVGLLEERDFFLQYGRDRSPRWVVLAYFEGNDLIQDIDDYARGRPFIVWQLKHHYQAALKRQLQKITLDGGAFLGGAARAVTAGEADTRYLYPLHLTLGSEPYELAFLDGYFGVLSARSAAIEASRNAQLLVDALATIRGATEESGGRLLVVYIPSKERLLLPEVAASGSLDHIVRRLPSVVLDESGFLWSVGPPLDGAALLASMDDQAQSVGRIVDSAGIHFLDLTTCFRAAVAQGRLLYYEYDTHWNQAGHDLAARLIADYLGNGSAGSSAAASTCR